MPCTPFDLEFLFYSSHKASSGSHTEVAHVTVVLVAYWDGRDVLPRGTMEHSVSMVLNL